MLVCGATAGPPRWASRHILGGGLHGGGGGVYHSKLMHTTRLASRESCESHLVLSGVTGEWLGPGPPRGGCRGCLGAQETDGQGPLRPGPSPSRFASVLTPGLALPAPGTQFCDFPARQKVAPIFP